MNFDMEKGTMQLMPTLDELLLLIRMEYDEMPDLKLTLAQARRLWDVPLDLCDAALGVLVAAGFLTRSREGSFLRSGGLHSSRSTARRHWRLTGRAMDPASDLGAESELVER